MRARAGPAQGLGAYPAKMPWRLVVTAATRRQPPDACCSTMTLAGVPPGVRPQKTMPTTFGNATNGKRKALSDGFGRSPARLAPLTAYSPDLYGLPGVGSSR